MSRIQEDVEEVRAAVQGLCVPGQIDVIAVFAWHGVSLRIWKGDPGNCFGPFCTHTIHEKCETSSRYYGLHTRKAREGFLADVRRDGTLFPALQKWSG
jgi:hypothetical protein